MTKWLVQNYPEATAFLASLARGSGGAIHLLLT
jgi:hypothetical protein